MKTISNEEKANEIATRWKAKGLPYNAIYDTAIEAMEWKDEQEIQFLQSLMFHATYYIFDRINERIKLLKGE